MKLFLVGHLSPSTDGGAYSMTFARIYSEHPDTLTRTFDGKSLPVVIMSAEGETYEEAHRRMKQRFKYQASFDPAIRPLKKMVETWKPNFFY